MSAAAFAAKSDLRARVVAVLRGQVPDRNMDLIPQPSRAVRAGDVHEIVLTDQCAGPGSKVNRVAYLAFVEFSRGGVLLYGDKVYCGGRLIGEVLGFDLSHSPNHMNVVARGDLVSGEERGLRPGDMMVFAPAQAEAHGRLQEG